MTTVVIKSIGATGRNYATLALWWAGKPTNLTQSRANTTQAGSTSSTIVLDSGASATNTDYVGHAIWCDARPTEKRLITSYNGATKTATVGSLNGSSATWDNTPGTEAYTIDSTIFKGELYNDGEFTAVDLLFYTGSVTDANNYFWLTPAAGQSFKDNAGAATLPLRYDFTKGVGFRSTGTYAALFRTDAYYFLIEGMQLKCDTESTDNSTATISGLVSTATYKDCIIETRKPFGPVGNANYAPTFINCIFAFTGTTHTGIAMRASPAAYNCTFVRPSDLAVGTNCFVNETTYYATVANCAVFGFTTPFAGTIGSYPGACTNNASDVAAGSIPGSNPQGSLTYTNQFENTANATRDWRPKTGAGVIGTGVRDQTHTNDLDIISAARSTSTPTIGAREYAAGESPSGVPKSNKLLLHGVG